MGYPCDQMDRKTQRLVDRLNADFEEVTGRPANHFFCPILFRDEDVELCMAHVVNQSFPEPDRTWTVQRADVDSHFGSVFESDFVKIQYIRKHTALDVLGHAELAKKLRPTIRVEGREIGHFVPPDRVPDGFSPILVEGAEGPVRLALKLSADETLAAMEKDWTVDFDLDLRLPALVSLLKAAHLTLFSMLGYRYALSAAGHFLGHSVLGEYLGRAVGHSKQAALKVAREHFAPFGNLVRPAPGGPTDLRGTAADGLLYLCMQGDAPWAMAVLVRVDGLLNAVLVPVFEESERAARFVRFMEDPSPTFEVALTRYALGRWEVSPKRVRFHWPRADGE